MDRRILYVVAVLYVSFRASLAATCATNFSSSAFVNGFGFSASHESVKNKANDAFTVGWCAGINSGSSIRPTLDVDFKHPYGIKSVTVSSPTNRDSYPYPTNVFVKYIPNGGNAFVDFPLAEGKLEIKLVGPGNAQVSFSQAVAAKQLQFTIQSYHGEDACLRIELVGCVEDDLCSGVCQNGGLCMYEDHCQCSGGFIGNHCKMSACTPEHLGISTGAIKPDQITVSSEDPTNNKAELGNALNKKGWCPLPSDQQPWVTIKLEEPKAVSVFSFDWSSHGNAQIMTEFELQYVALVDSSKRFRTFSTDIPSMNGTHIFTVFTTPVMVTDTIRILPTNSTGRSCFKLEISGCDPKTLCLAGWCLNNGTCMGENVCRCPANFFGDRCEQTRNDIVHTNLTFVNITNNVIITTSKTFQFHITGNVVLQTIENKPVVTINGLNSCIQLSSTTGTSSCVTDINHCSNGFTFIVDIKFISMVDNTYIVSSGGNVPGNTGITLFYVSNTLHFVVSTTNSIWTLIVPYKPMLNVWQHFELTWHKNLGVELIVNGHSLGSNSRPAPQQAVAVTLPLSIGCSHTNINVNNHMQVTGILSWSIDRTELVNAGIKDPPATTKVRTTFMPTTYTSTTLLPTTTTNEPITSTVTTSTISTKTATTTVKSSTLSVASTAMKTTFKTDNILGPVCLDCRDLSHIYLCDTIKQCTANQVCYVEKFLTNSGHIRYNTGCSDNLNCLKSQGGIVKRSTECVSCCNTSLCNTNGCGSQGLPPRDQRGPLCYDCPYVSSMDECSIIKLCGQDEVCTIEKHDWGGVYSRFTAKCHSKQCVSHTRSVHINQGLRLGPRSVPECQRCCGDDLCNDVCNVTSHTDSILPIIG